MNPIPERWYEDMTTEQLLSMGGLGIVALLLLWWIVVLVFRSKGK